MQTNRASLIACVLLSLTLIGLQGCSSKPKVIYIKAEPIDSVPLILPDVDRLELEDTKFYVITEENYQTIFDELRKKNYEPVIFGVTDDGYQILSVNNAKVLQLVMQQSIVIEAYKDYYERTKDAIKQNNDDLSAKDEAAQVESQQSEGQGGIISNGILKRLLPW